MSWSGNYDGPDGDVQKAIKKFEDIPKSDKNAVASGRIALASVFYSYCTRLFCESKLSFKKGKLMKAASHLRQSVRYGRKALYQVDMAWENEYWVENKVSHDQIEVSLSVWVTVGLLRGGRKSDARKVINDKINLRILLRRSCKTPAHTKAFLLCHAISLNKGYLLTTKNIKKLCQLAWETEGDNAEQAIRIWKKISSFWKKLGSGYSTDADLADDKASYLAEIYSADQVAKLSANN